MDRGQVQADLDQVVDGFETDSDSSSKIQVALGMDQSHPGPPKIHIDMCQRHIKCNILYFISSNYELQITQQT